MYAIFLTADMCCELGKRALVSTLILIHPMDKSGDKSGDKSVDKYTTAKTCLKHHAPEHVGGVPAAVGGQVVKGRDKPEHIGVFSRKIVIIKGC